MNFRKDENGQIFVLTALSMTILLGFMAFAIDVGMLFNDKRKIQNAVDAAATSAAIDYMFNYSKSSATTAANSAVTANGISNATVTVHFAPNITTSYHNLDYYVEVIATEPAQTFFMNLFNRSSVTVKARAVAGIPAGIGDACVIVLDPTASKSMNLQGSFDVSASGCGVIVDSTASDALYLGGSSGTLTAGYVAVVGGDTGSISDSTPTPVLNATPIYDPLNNFSGPTSADCTSANTNSASSYTGSSFLTANNITCFSASNVSFSGTTTFPPGIVVFENGASLGGTVNSSSNGSNLVGTTLDNLSGAFTVSAGTTLGITAPTAVQSSPSTDTTAWSVPAGVAFLQPLSNKNVVSLQTGNEYGYLSGYIYAPGGQCYLNDSGGDKSGGTGTGSIQYTTDFICGTFYDKTATLKIYSYSNSAANSSSLTRVSLVE